MRMTKRRWISLTSAIGIPLAAIGVAFATGLVPARQASHVQGGAATGDQLITLSSGDIVISFDSTGDQVVLSLDFPTWHTTGRARWWARSVGQTVWFHNNTNTGVGPLVNLRPVEPCHDAIRSGDGSVVGRVVADVWDAAGNPRGSTCDENWPERSIIAPGEMWRLVVSLDANTALTSGDKFDVLFKAVGPPASIPPPAGMVSWWPGDNHPNDIWDSNDGILTGDATYTGGKVGQAFSLDGSDDYVEVAHNPNLDPGTGSFTIDAWVKTTSTGSQYVVSKYEGGQTGIANVTNSVYHMHLSGGKLSARLRDTDKGGDEGGGQSLQGTTFIADGRFHHIAILRDIAANKLLLYVDGVLDTGDDLNAGATGAIKDDDNSPDHLVIGAKFVASQTTKEFFFSGVIDEVEFFNPALSADEIRAIYDAGSAGKIKAKISFLGPRAQAGPFGVPMANLPNVGGKNTQGVRAYDRNGPTEPFFGSIAYLHLASPKTGTAPYTMTSTSHMGFDSLAGLGAEQLSYDFQDTNMLTSNVIHKENDAPISFNDPLFDILDNVVYFREEGTLHNMEKRTYTGGTWSLINNAGTTGDGSDDSTIASGDIIFITLFLDYTDAENSGHGIIRVNPGSAFQADLLQNFGTPALRMTINSRQFPVFQDDPGGATPTTEMYAVFDASNSLTPARPPE